MKFDTLSGFRGSLVGLAVGDALGMPVEGLSEEDIRSKFGLLTQIIDGLRPAGSVTDDTMQMLCVAESIAENGHFDPDDIMRRLLQWFRTDPFGIGVHTWRVLSLVDMGMDWRKAVETVEQKYAPWTAGNGSLTRCVPIALRYCYDIGGLMEYSAESSQLTHANPLCIASCVFFNALVSRVLRGWDKKEALSFAVELTEHICPNELHERIEGFFKKFAKDIGRSGFVLDTLECALWVWWHHDNFEEALLTAVNFGGDTDTNGAVVGALMGATCGIDAIPKRWIEIVSISQRCDEVAIKLYELATK